MHSDGRLFVARFDYAESSRNGLITILSPEGEEEEDLEVDDLPEITGLWFSRASDEILYATESSQNCLLKIQVPPSTT